MRPVITLLIGLFNYFPFRISNYFQAMEHLLESDAGVELEDFLVAHFPEPIAVVNDLVFFVVEDLESMVELHGSAAWVSEDRVDAEVLEATYHDIAAVHLDAGLGGDGGRSFGGGLLGGVLFRHGQGGGWLLQGMG